MYTAGHRALQAQALGAQRVEWLGRLPDRKEDVQSLPPAPADEEEASWFRIKSAYGFLPTSVVLLEKVIRKDDLRVPSEQHTRFSAPDKRKPKFGRKSLRKSTPTTTTTTTTLHGRDLQQADRKSTRVSTTVGAGRERKRGKLTRARTGGGGEADWRHSGARTIDHGLRKDGLGPVPSQAAASLEVIRRMELSTEGFFEFLFSDRWSEGCLLRVLRGKLLDTLLYVLNQMQKDNSVVCYSTTGFIYENKPLVPCSKTATINNATGQADKRILVELDCFVPQTPPDPEVVAKMQSSTLDLSWLHDLHSHSMVDVSETLAEGGYRCNMRGQEKPPPHSHCFGPYHIQREPVLLRRHRKKSCFVHPPLPWLLPSRSFSIDQKQGSTTQHLFSTHSLHAAVPSGLFSSRSRDESCRREKLEESFLGPRLKDGSETVASDPYLESIDKMLSEGYTPCRRLSHVPERLPSEDSKIPADPKKKNKKMMRFHKEESSDDEESDTSEVRLNIDPSREAMLRKDLEQMSSDLIARKPISLSQKEGRRDRLGKKRKVKYRATEHEKGKKRDHSNVTMKKPATKESDKKQKAAKEPLKNLSKKEQPCGFPRIKQWPTRPTFTEFCHLLQKEQAEAKKEQFARANAGRNLPTLDTKSKMQSKRKQKLQKLGVLTSKRSDSTWSEKSQNSKQCDSTKSVTRSRDHTRAGERRKNAGKAQMRDQKSPGKRENRRESRAQEKRSPAAYKRTPTIDFDEDSPYVYISDSEIPNDINAKTLFSIMQVDRNFKPEKLKSSYSFEKLYAHRAEELPNYAKLLNKFSKPFKKKKPRPIPAYKKGVTKRGRGKPHSPSSPRTRTETAPSSPPTPEPSSPPMVIGTLKDFNFLQYKTFIPNPQDFFSISREEMTCAHIVQLLSAAMQAFVVRKERATIFGWSQCDSRVSLTFSRPGPEDALLGVPPLKGTAACIDSKPSGDLPTTERLHS